MKSWFFELVDALCACLHAGEVLLCSLSAERSDFVRFNHARVRQGGAVDQRYVTLRLIRESRQASVRVALAGISADAEIGHSALAKVREMLTQLPEDPLLLYAEEPRSTSVERRGRLPRAEDVVAHATRAAAAVDFVGFYAAGTIFRGFANSLGQRNWHEVDTFNFDWSLHLEGAKAVKDAYAGFDWDAPAFEAKLAQDVERLELLRAPARTLPPAEYRTYLTPYALEEITNVLQWGAFSARRQATRQSPLLRMQSIEHSNEPPATLSPKVTLLENTEAGVAPAFQEDGFVRAPVVTLIEAGALRESLVSPRSAREYGLEVNGANAGEIPESLDMLPGTLEPEGVLAALDTGLYVSNLWYLNYSDRPAARITGMTRFATFWVENGRLAGPVAPLRFDDTLFRMLGTELADLTSTRELIISASTYDERSTSSARLPGALLERLRFTL